LPAPGEVPKFRCGVLARRREPAAVAREGKFTNVGLVTTVPPELAPRPELPDCERAVHVTDSEELAVRREFRGERRIGTNELHFALKLSARHVPDLVGV